MVRDVVAALLVLASAGSACAQSPRPSQRAEMLQMLDSTEIRVRYIRPVARGRALFGSLVKYGRMWTPSADSAMLISFSRPVEIEGKPLAAGSYSVWAIPDSTQWTLVFNKVARAFHIGAYHEGEDALRVTAKVDSLPHVETLTLDFPIVDGRRAMMRIHWGTTAISARIDAK
jgi:hypothetical protein